jgi:hypothetical protein
MDNLTHDTLLIPPIHQPQPTSLHPPSPHTLSTTPIPDIQDIDERNHVPSRQCDHVPSRAVRLAPRLPTPPPASPVEIQSPRAEHLGHTVAAAVGDQPGHVHHLRAHRQRESVLRPLQVPRSVHYGSSPLLVHSFWYAAPGHLVCIVSGERQYLMSHVRHMGHPSQRHIGRP